MKGLISVFLSLICTAFAAESQLDLRVDADPINLQRKTSINITSTTSVKTPDEQHGFLITPEMSFYHTGGIDFSVTGAHRHRWDNWVLGHNIFFDRTNFDQFSLDQIGTGVDLQTPRFDFRANCYFPISTSNAKSLKPCKWVDSEIFFKTPYFGIGTGPLYNIDLNTWALHSRIVVPMKDITLNLGGICGAGNYAQNTVMFSMSFHLFKPKKSDALTLPACHVHKSSIYYKSNYSYNSSKEDDKLHSTKPRLKLNYNPNVVVYIDQLEEESTLVDREIK